MKIKILCVCLIFCLMPSAFSADISMRGFASIVGGQTLASDESLYGYDNNPDFRNDSLAAIQFNADLDDGLCATVQMVARGTNDFDVGVEWAYMTYEFSDSVKISAGRMRIPFYRYSDFLDVRYTYNWVKGPSTIYGQPLPGYDGISLLINSSFGSWDSSLQLIAGTMADVSLGPATLSFDQLFGVNWTMTRDWLTLRATYLPFRVSNTNAGFTGMAQMSEALGQSLMVDTSELTNWILSDDDPGYFGGFSAGIDYNDWLIDFEYITYGTDTIVSEANDAYYISLGKRIGKFTPFITVSSASADPDTRVFNRVSNDVWAAPEAIPLQGALMGFTSATEVETDLTVVGLRYDFHDSAALKVEYATEDDVNNNTNSVIRVGIDLIF